MRCAACPASARARGATHARAAASAGVDTGHNGWARSSSAITPGAARTYPMRSPASPQVFVRLQHDEAGHVGPPGQRLPLTGHRVHERLVHHQRPPRTGQARRSSPPDAGPTSDWWGCRSPPGRRPPARPPDPAGTRSASRSSTRSTACPASRNAASGSVNCGCTTTGRRAPPARGRAARTPSAAPAVSSTRSTGSPCRAASRLRGPPVRVGREGRQRAGDLLPQPRRGRVRADVDGEVDQRRPRRPGTSASPWCRRSCPEPPVASVRMAAGVPPWWWCPCPCPW